MGAPVNIQNMLKTPIGNMVDEDEIDETTSLSTMGPGHQQGVVFATDSCHQTGVCQIKVFVVLGVQTSTDSWSRDTVS